LGGRHGVVPFVEKAPPIHRPLLSH
jgi:hypothetical protein